MSRSKEKVVSSLRKIFKSKNPSNDDLAEDKKPSEADSTAKKPTDSPGKRIRRLEKK